MTQVAIITGASSGIGLATARHLAGLGMAIVGVGRDPAKLESLNEAVGDSSRLATLAMDVIRDEAPSMIVGLAMERWNRVDYLINNAGIGNPKPLHETDDATLDSFLGVLLRAPFRLARDALTQMKPGSAIINVTSTFAVVGGLRGGAYSAAKAGLHGLTTHIAAQYGALGIRANSVAPGVIDTPMVHHRLADERFKRMQVEMTPYPRLGNVDDVAATIAFLCSPGGAFINGQQIVVDGGWSDTKYLSPRALSSVWTDPSV